MLITRPPMGWNSWNTFGAEINETLIKGIADAMVDTGLRDAGYEYVVIDDCWSLHERDANGLLVADPEKFPNGMKAIAEYIHSKGLKFGMYTCSGPYTCAGYPGSFEHEFVDAQTFASWDVDYLKVDNCMKPDIPSPALYNTMGMALRTTGRDIVYSMCNWGRDDSWKWARSVGASLYRSTGDISDNYETMKNIMLSQLPNQPYNTPGCYNDVDMLITGMYGKGNVALGGCYENEYLFHFALWCFFQSPLMIGCDIRQMSKAARQTLMNRELIRINQDAECRQPYLVQHLNDAYVYLKHLEDGEYAIGMFNFGDKKVDIPCEFFRFGLQKSTRHGLDMVNIMTGEKYLHQSGSFVAPSVEPHFFRMYRAKVVTLD